MRRCGYAQMRIMGRVDAGLDHTEHGGSCFALTRAAMLSGIYSPEEWKAYQHAYAAQRERLAADEAADEPAGTG